MRNDELSLRHKIREKFPNLLEEPLPDDDKNVQFICEQTKDYCFLSRILSIETTKCWSLKYFLSQAIAESDIKKFKLVTRYNDEEFSQLCNQVSERASLPSQWVSKYVKYMDESPRPSLKQLKSLLAEGEKIPYNIEELKPLKSFVEKASEWVEEVQALLTRKLHRRNNDKLRINPSDEKSSAQANVNVSLTALEKEQKSPEYFQSLIDAMPNLPFVCPEVTQLQERAIEIQQYSKRLERLLNQPQKTIMECMEILDLGNGLNVTLPETEILSKIVDRMKWRERVSNLEGKYMDLDSTIELIKDGQKADIDADEPLMQKLALLKAKGEHLEERARIILASESTRYEDIVSLSEELGVLPMSKSTTKKIHEIQATHINMVKQIEALQKTFDNDTVLERASYKDVKATIDNARSMRTRPDVLGLEKGTRAVEEWMRKGKRFFGKGNAPLYILGTHLSYVEKRNNACFSLKDVFNPVTRFSFTELQNGKNLVWPGGEENKQEGISDDSDHKIKGDADAEYNNNTATAVMIAAAAVAAEGNSSGPTTVEPVVSNIESNDATASIMTDAKSTAADLEADDINSLEEVPESGSKVFCLCRMPESGLMVECDVCHEWYHGKCLKIGRSKVKVNEKFTCPICDWRLEIPRDAHRPKLEDLESLESQTDILPNCPDELPILKRIILVAREFRRFLKPMLRRTYDDSDIEELRFYLRKLEGGDVLLAQECNFFRQETHRLAPIATRPPVQIYTSRSTRKPRSNKSGSIGNSTKSASPFAGFTDSNDERGGSIGPIDLDGAEITTINGGIIGLSNSPEIDNHAADTSVGRPLNENIMPTLSSANSSDLNNGGGNGTSTYPHNYQSFFQSHTFPANGSPHTSGSLSLLQNETNQDIHQGSISDEVSADPSANKSSNF